MPTLNAQEYELVPVERLKNHPRNPRRGSIADIRESIRTNGFYGAIVVQRSTSYVLVGNHRFRAAREEKLEQVPVVWLDVDDARAARIALADNRTSDKATYDHAELVEMLTSLDTLAGTAFDPKDLAKLVRQTAPPAPEIEDVPPEAPVAEETVVKAGDVWALGDHRLVCGDSLVEETRELALGGKKVDAVITDPPFAIYGSSTGIGADIADDKMVRPFFEKLFVTLNGIVKIFGHAYVFCDWRSWPAIWDAAGRARGANRGGLSASNLLVWDKGSSGMGAMYSNCHELVGFFTCAAPARAMKGRKAGARTVNGKSNVLRYNRVTGSERQHNAAKSVPMLEELIANSTDPGDTVADLFGGSGSTLIACERTGRRCVMFELEPGWCDVIVRRWQALTGKEATRV